MAAVETRDDAHPRFLAQEWLARPDVGNRVGRRGIEERRLVRRRQITAAIDTDAPERRPAPGENDKPRHLPAIAPQAIRHPGPGAGMAGEGKAAVEMVVGLGVFVGRAGHRADHSEVVGTAGDAGEKITHRQAAFPPAAKLPRAGHDRAVGVEHRRLHRHRHRLAMVDRQPRLGIERVDSRDAPRHEAEDHAADAGCRCRGPGRSAEIASRRQRREGHGAKAGRGPGEESTARHRWMAEAWPAGFTRHG